MEIPIIVALIGAAATIAAPLVGIALANWSRSKDLKLISKDRKNTLTGCWEGTGIQEAGGNISHSIKSDVVANLKAGKKELSGKLSYQFELKGKLILQEMNLSGGFLFERYLLLNYKNQSDGVIQFGSVVLELDSSGTRMFGRFVGYGKISEDIIHGSIDLHKAP